MALLHGAELIVNWEEANGAPRWYAVVPRDDGTVAAGVTASLLSDGARGASLRFEGNEIAVTRLGRPGSFFAAHAGDGVIFGSARDELTTAVGRLTRAKEVPERERGPGAAHESVPCCVPTPLESGASFVLDASRLATMHSGPIPIRLAGELVRGLSCGSAHGVAALEGGRLGIDVTTHFRVDKGPPSPLWDRAAAIERSWLELMPSTGAIAVISLSLHPSPAYWDSAFALADALEKTDSARAALRPCERD